MKRSKKLSLSLLALASGVLVASTAIGLASCTTTNTTQNSEIKTVDITNYDSSQEINVSTITRLSVKVENTSNTDLVYSWTISKPSSGKEVIEKTNVNYLDVDTSDTKVEENWDINVKVYPKEDKSQILRDKSVSLKVEPKYDYEHGTATWIDIESLTISKNEILAGEDTSTLSVSAKSSDGANLSYQWMVAKDGLHFENIHGATSSTYTIQRTDTNALKKEATWVYAVQISNGRITTQSDNLTVNVKLKDVVFLGQSIVATSLVSGDEVNLGVYAEWQGDPKYSMDDMLYDWYVKKPGTDEFVHRQGGSLSTYKFIAPWINKYEQWELYVQAYPRSFWGKPNKDQVAQFSQKIVLTILPQREQLTVKASIDKDTITPGQVVTLTADAKTTVESAQNKLHYQWQILKNGVWKNINGANSPTYVVNKDATIWNPNEVWQYRCVITGISGSVRNSNIVTLTIKDYPGNSGNTDENNGNNGGDTNNGSGNGGETENNGNGGDTNENTNNSNGNENNNDIVKLNSTMSYENTSVGVDSNWSPVRTNAKYKVNFESGVDTSNLTYQWYWTTIQTYDTTNGTKIEGAVSSEYSPSNDILQKAWEISNGTRNKLTFYCEIYKDGKLVSVANGYSMDNTFYPAMLDVWKDLYYWN